MAPRQQIHRKRSSGARDEINLSISEELLQHQTEPLGSTRYGSPILLPLHVNYPLAISLCNGNGTNAPPKTNVQVDKRYPTQRSGRITDARNPLTYFGCKLWTKETAERWQMKRDWSFGRPFQLRCLPGRPGCTVNCRHDVPSC